MLNVCFCFTTIHRRVLQVSAKAGVALDAKVVRQLKRITYFDATTGAHYIF